MQKDNKNPQLLLLLLLLTVFMTEFGLMFLLHFFPELPTLVETLIDATLLVSVIGPVLFVFIFRPLVNEIAARRKAEESLSASVENEKKKADEVRALNQQLAANEEQLKATNHHLLANQEALQAKMKELDKMNKFMVDREMRIIEMKKEVNKLCKELGRPEPYHV
jgi:septal ring factor EnvC (AmiA/AmiB activator)